MPLRARRSLEDAVPSEEEMYPGRSLRSSGSTHQAQVRNVVPQQANSASNRSNYQLRKMMRLRTKKMLQQEQERRYKKERQDRKYWLNNVKMLRTK